MHETTRAADVERKQTDPEVLQAVAASAAAMLTEPPRRAAAFAYLRQRGIDATALGSQWLLGYAPPGWTRLVDRLGCDFPEQALLDAGVATRSSRGSLIDTFRDRVVFGIHELDGTIAGFIGRDLSGHPGAPKYLNTHQNTIFDKGRLLYGAYEGTHEAAGRQPVVVEGPLDVLAIATRQHHKDAELLPLAACGTAFTETHARRVAESARRGGSRVVVAMDSDMAGRCAALKVGERLREHGLDVRVAVLPNGSDPAEHLVRPGSSLDTFRADHGLSLINVHVENATAAQGDRMQWVEGRLAALRSLTGYLATYPPNYTGRQVAWLADVLHLDHSTVTSELVDGYHRAARLPEHSRAAQARPTPILPASILEMR